MKEPLLVHICCGPDFTVVAERLLPHYNVVGFFYNPCIHPIDEYEKRLLEARKVADFFETEVINGIYDIERWLEKIRGFEDEPEKGKRCEICFRMRFETTAEEALKLGIETFTTTLSVSPKKDFECLKRIGEEVALKSGVKFLAENFKKKDGFRRSVELSKKLRLYRQSYCGCKFSVKDRK